MFNTYKEETSIKDLKLIWNKYNEYSKLNYLLKNLREDGGIRIKDWLHIPIHEPFISKEIKNLPKGSKILEAGCGFGQWVFWMAEQGFDVTGVDISEKAINIAKKYIKNNKIKNCKFLEKDIRKTSFKDGYFDYIFSFGVVEHFRNPDVILKEFKRILKPGGKIFLSMPNKYSFHSISRPILKLFSKWNLGYETSYSQKLLKMLFKRNDLIVLKCGIMPGGEFFGRGISNLPFLGPFLFKKLSKVSFYLENHQNKLGFWLYGVAKKRS